MNPPDFQVKAKSWSHRCDRGAWSILKVTLSACRLAVFAVCLLPGVRFLCSSLFLTGFLLGRLIYLFRDQLIYISKDGERFKTSRVFLDLIRKFVDQFSRFIHSVVVVFFTEQRANNIILVYFSY